MCQTNISPAGRRKSSAVRVFIVSALLLVAVIFCLSVLLTQRASIELVWHRVPFSALVLSTLLGGLGLALFPVCLCELYGGLEQNRFNALALCYAYYIANIFKYIPGKVLTFAAVLEGARDASLARSKALQALMATMGLSIAISLGLTLAIILPLFSNSSWVLAISFTSAVPAVLVVLPATNAWITDLVLRGLRRRQDVPRFRLKNLARGFIIMLAAWALSGASFAVLVGSCGQISANRFAACALAYPAAFTAGFLVLIAPAGVGIREGILVGFLVQAVGGTFAGSEGAAIALSVVLTHRLLMTMVDLLLLGVGLAGRVLLARA